MDVTTFHQNKKAYLSYNNFRKQIFAELAPGDSEIILYMLPWMLSINDPAVPGYIPDLKTAMAVHGVHADPGILKRESVFRNILKISKPLSIGATPLDVLRIQGLYTIGSIGTISQTSGSDCDIWICIDKKDFTDAQFQQLIQKTNLIKDWLDIHARTPVYFFICDIADIRISHFGSVDRESSGSTQTNTLKEEFYRTTILIAGKIPLWWLCCDGDKDVDYSGFLAGYLRGDFKDDDCLDMGRLDAVEKEEYFGAALWLFNKALTHPLKSIIKMLLLEMLLASPRHELLCHRFRSSILNRERDPQLIDPSTFALEAILKFNQSMDSETFDFVKKCFYLRYDFKLHQKTTLKEIIGKDIFQRHPIPRPEIEHLNTFATWPLPEQIRFGQTIFDLLVKIYKRVSRMEQGSQSGVHPEDLNIIGRKLSVSLTPKPNKINLFHWPVRVLNIPAITFAVDSRNEWCASTPGSPAIVAGPDIVYCITCLIWNGIFEPGLVKMTPNTTSVTLQEINSLAARIRDIFGVHDVSGIDFEYFTQTERVTKMLIVVNFEGHSQDKNADDFAAIYKNNWGEIFVRRFRSSSQFHEFVQKGGDKFVQTEIHYYIQRNALYYEKIIERTKGMVTQGFSATRK
ncbi:MAG: class I adenylate cyclase [Deltaproteobacteria bacterium]